ncbi:hypothetical protein HOL34_02715 [bacterium]|jgi:hypothetical protein|nr:hypothetical protein [bacterium]MBT4577966.1 hypothetical protein [bacterium]MBT5346078.1 hypothetical protein [bacterium]MBT6131428.1 hypothetical protein [bacterium]MBT6528989.1 hypothetical protein [bacterium]
MKNWLLIILLMPIAALNAGKGKNRSGGKTFRNFHFDKRRANNKKHFSNNYSKTPNKPEPKKNSTQSAHIPTINFKSNQTNKRTALLPINNSSNNNVAHKHKSSLPCNNSGLKVHNSQLTRVYSKPYYQQNNKNNWHRN